MSMEERRKYSRVGAVLEIRYKAEDEFKNGTCTSLDISIGGIGLGLQEKINPGTILELEIRLPDTPYPLFVKGRLIWCFKAPEAEEGAIIAYRAGITFTEVSDAAKKRLQDYIQMLLSEQANP